MTLRNGWLLTGGGLSAAAAVLHLAIIVGGPTWYRVFGAGERMARMAARGNPEPAVIAVAIASVLALWSAYGLSGAGVLPRLPLLRTGLVLISAAYLLRAAALPVMLRTMPDRSPAFLIWSSLVVLAFGVAYALGTWTAWSRLAPA